MSDETRRWVITAEVTFTVEIPPGLPNTMDTATLWAADGLIQHSRLFTNHEPPQDVEVFTEITGDFMEEEVPAPEDRDDKQHGGRHAQR